jgi:hypothetical protein
MVAFNAKNVIVIDQLGDAIITLKNPNAPFHIWKEESDAGSGAEEGNDADEDDDPGENIETTESAQDLNSRKGGP